ncbi:hypothetical protein SCLCIDRAFT_9780 [Scleroderma citrinum Foug A]|uniref:Uncharacterized protein n=1 Tax=Scleroderma citrinum Foug A TaxID=1036808 RepID=A0A0C3DV78_9AGAM|nr:hypothetical protein SCLCIDRAFT_9780 [Scleroderma citrinum Foug A]
MEMNVSLGGPLLLLLSLTHVPAGSHRIFGNFNQPLQYRRTSAIDPNASESFETLSLWPLEMEKKNHGLCILDREGPCLARGVIGTERGANVGMVACVPTSLRDPRTRGGDCCIEYCRGWPGKKVEERVVREDRTLRRVRVRVIEKHRGREDIDIDVEAWTPQGLYDKGKTVVPPDG